MGLLREGLEVEQQPEIVVTAGQRWRMLAGEEEVDWSWTVVMNTRMDSVGIELWEVGGSID